MHHFGVGLFFSHFPRGACTQPSPAFFFFFFFPRAVLVFLGRQRIPHAPHFSLPHVFPAGMFKQEAPLSKRLPSLHPPHPFYQIRARAMGDVIPVPTFTPQKPGREASDWVLLTFPEY